MAGPLTGSSDHVARNRRHWESRSADYQRDVASQLNRWDRLGWGVWDLPEDEIGALGDVRGLRALEFGCGACQFGIKVAMRGAAVTGLDLSGAQLRQGLEHMDATDVRYPVVQADGERVPFADGTFDLAFCDHGVMGFADPYVTVPEVARVLRPGGRFVFSTPTPIIWMAWGDEDAPAGRELRRGYFGMHRAEVNDPGWATTEFQLPYGAWIRLFRAAGFRIEDLIELRPPANASSAFDYVTLEWAREFPAEHIWVVRKD
jgi:SAM-dependent methyltransferase